MNNQIDSSFSNMKRLLVMKETAIQKAKEIVGKIHTKFDKGELNQTQAITQMQSLISILERCVNKHNIPGNGKEDTFVKKAAHKQFPDLKLSTLNFNPKITGN